MNCSSVGSTTPTDDSRDVGAGRQLEEFAQERLDAKVRQRAPEEHRRQVAREHGALVERMPRLVEQRDVLHQPVVRLVAEEVPERRVAQRADLDAGPARAVVVAPLEQVDDLLPPVVYADERAVAVDRPRHRMAGDLQVGFDVAHQLERVLPHPIALVHEGEDRHPAALADGEELARPVLDASSVIQQHHRAVRRDERTVGVLREILVAGRVEQVDLVPVVLELHHARRHRDAALLLELHPVRRGMARRTPRLHRAGEVDGAAVKQEIPPNPNEFDNTFRMR